MGHYNSLLTDTVRPRGVIWAHIMKARDLHKQHKQDYRETTVHVRLCEPFTLSLFGGIVSFGAVYLILRQIDAFYEGQPRRDGVYWDINRHKYTVTLSEAINRPYYGLIIRNLSWNCT